MYCCSRDLDHACCPSVHLRCIGLGTLLCYSCNLDQHVAFLLWWHLKKLLCTGGFWSIPAENLRPLLDVINSDLASSGCNWDGYSQTLKEYFEKSKIDPKLKYSRFYVTGSILQLFPTRGADQICTDLQTRRMTHAMQANHCLSMFLSSLSSDLNWIQLKSSRQLMNVTKTATYGFSWMIRI